MAEVSPAYLIVSDDDYLAQQAVEKILDVAGRDSVKRTGPDGDLSGVVGELRTPSMFGARRVVVIKDADAIGAEGATALAGYLESPDPSSVLVLVTAKAPPKLAAAIRKVGRVVEATKGRRSEVFSWLREEAKARGVQMSSDAYGTLVEAVGDDRGALAGALDILSLSATSRLGPDDVERQFRGKADPKVFAFVDAVAERKAPVALDALGRLLGAGESAQALFWTLTRHLRLLLLANGSPKEVAASLGLPLWRAEKVVRQASLYRPNDLRWAWGILAEADRKMKASEEPEDITLLRTVASLLGR